MSRSAANPAASASLRTRIIGRVACAVLGGYAFAWGLVAATTALLFAAGLEFHDAEFTGAVVGLLGYLVAFLWAIAARRQGVAWAVLLGGGVVMTGAASLVQSMLV